MTQFNPGQTVIDATIEIIEEATGYSCTKEKAERIAREILNEYASINPVPADQDNQPKPDPVHGEWVFDEKEYHFMLHGRYISMMDVAYALNLHKSEHTALTAQVKRLEGEVERLKQDNLDLHNLIRKDADKL